MEQSKAWRHARSRPTDIDGEASNRRVGRGPASCRAALRMSLDLPGAERNEPVPRGPRAAEPERLAVAPGGSSAGGTHLTIRKAQRKRVNFSASRALSYEGRAVDALASSADEGRGTLR